MRKSDVSKVVLRSADENRGRSDDLSPSRNMKRETSTPRPAQLEWARRDRRDGEMSEHSSCESSQTWRLDALHQCL
jgi:hypothetical protein